MASYGIIYAAGSKAVRRIVVSDDPSYDYSAHVGPGEAHIVADKKLGSDVFAARAAVEAATGIKSPEPLAAVVDKNGVVVGMVLADPTLDAVANHDLISAYVGVFEGCTYDRASDTFVAPARVVAAGTDDNGNPFPEKTEPARPVPKPAASVSDAAIDGAG